ncbi:TPA: restriction endonuclease subunit S [Legionella pneumophila]|nr:restriction endonuclease subunit S [Legionella pneumophila]
MTAYPAYKDSGISWLSTIPEHWDVKPLRAIFKIRNEKNNPVKTHQILSLSIAQGVTLYSDKGRGGNKAKEDLTAYKIAYPNDIVVNSMNVIVGAVGLSKYLGAISPVYYAIYLRSVQNNDINYYATIFGNHKFQRYLSIYGKGILIKKTDSGKLNTIRMKISLEDFKKIILPLPPIDEQTKIAKYLDWKTTKINKFIKAKKTLIALLKEQKQNIINEAVTKGINPDVKMKDSGVDWLGEIPGHWLVRKLKQVATFNPSKSESLKTVAIDNYVTFLPMEKISVEGKISCDLKMPIKHVMNGFTYFKKNDVVLAKITPCFENGKGAYLSELDTEFGFGTTELFVLRPQGNIFGAFLRLILQSHQFLKLGERNMSGAAGQQRLQSNFLKNFQIGLPSYQEQMEITNYVQNKVSVISNVISRSSREIELIQEYQTRLISDVVTGKIDVRSIQVPDFEPVESDIDHSDDQETEELVMEDIEE